MLISQYVDKYRTIIDMTYPITGKYVTYQKGFYDDKSDDYIKDDLRFTVLIIYLKFAVEYGLKATSEKAIKKIFGDIKESSNV